MILSNQVECKKCGDRPYSGSVHDFSSCKCGNIAVDGGMEYLRRHGGLTYKNGVPTYRDISIDWEVDLVDALGAALEQSVSDYKNSLGHVCTVARTLRDNGYEIIKSDELKQKVKE